MKAKVYLLSLLVALSLILALVGLPLQAQPLAGAQAGPVLSQPAEKGGTTWEQLPPEIQAKVDPRILKELNGEIVPAHLGGRSDQADVAPQDRQPIDKTRFLVYLKAQTDLKAVAAQPFATLTQQRSAVADALIQTAQVTQGPVKSVLDMSASTGSVASYQPFYIFNGFAVEGNWDTVVELAKRDDVERIAANYPLIKYDQPTKSSASPANGLGGLDPANWNIDLVDADRVWNELGVNGAGAVVGDFDTGVQWDHPALKSQYRGWNGTSANHNYNWFEPDSSLYPGGDLGPSASDIPTWCDNHGVHTMGTMVGDGGTANTKIGMAPGAKWIAVPGICGNTMPGDWGDDIGGNKAFQWFLCPTDLTGDLATRDCSKAPDVVNNSWGSSNPADDTFRPAIQALRAAGIMPVFAAGNPGSGPGSIGSPGSAPEAFTVGATNIEDTVASFSGRGPSFYEGVQKPNVTAPGVNIKSSVGGSSYDATYSGTSMAAPAVSGLVALMVSADLKDGRRDLNVDEIQKFIESTVVKLGATTPNDDYGYGRIDAYNAVRWALAAGNVKGTVTDANTAAPIDDATIAGAKPPDIFTSRSANGTYSTTVPGGLYNVTVNAFGYTPGTFVGVSVLTGTNSIINFSLTPLPVAILTGAVVSGTTPISGAVVYVDAKPSVTFTTGANGLYTLTLPVGTQALTVEAKGYRIQEAEVTVASGGAAHNFTLTPAPTILLVEADGYLGWFGGRPAHNFFQLSLDQRNYLYDTTVVTNSASLVQLTTVMTPTNYRVVIWIHTANAPSGYGYTTLLQNYLNAGGRLIISGQNIGYWDASTSFFQNYLHATYSMDSAAGMGDKVSGLGFLGGLNLTLNEAAQYNYANTTLSLSPDAVAPRNGSAYPVMTYDNGNGAAALAVDPCGAPYRAVYFAVGYENLGPRAYSRPPEYADVLDRSIQWVIGTKPAYGVDASVSPGSKILPPGSVFTYSLTIGNMGVNTDAYNLALAGNVWPTRIVSGTTPVTQTMQLPACSQQVLGVEVTIPGTANAGATDTFTVTAASQGSPVVNSQASAKTTSFELWRNEANAPYSASRVALAAAGNGVHLIGGDGGNNNHAEFNACTSQWTNRSPIPVGTSNHSAAGLGDKVYVSGGYVSAVLDNLQIYDSATDSWSSGAPMPEARWAHATVALNGEIYVIGGLDSTSTNMGTTFVYSPTLNAWRTAAELNVPRGWLTAGVVNGKIYAVGGSGELNTVEEYDPVIDTWVTKEPMLTGRAGAGAVGAGGYLYVAGGGWSSYLASAERYNPLLDKWEAISNLNTGRRSLGVTYAAGRIFAADGWNGSYRNNLESLRLADAFCLSNKQVQQTTVQPGDRITYTLELHSDLTALPNARVLDPLPAGTTFGGFGPATASPAPTFNSGQNRVEWAGSIPSGQTPVTFTFGVAVNPGGWVNGQLITNTATFSDGVSLTFNRTTTSVIGFFDLTPSTKSVNKALARAGEVLTYTVHVENASLQNGAFTLTDPIPANATYASGSLTYTVGSAGYAAGVITWTGQLPRIISYTNNSSSYEYADDPFTAGTAALSPFAQLAWEDMAGATALSISNLDDSVSGPFPIGFSFPWFGTTRTQFWVDTNGRIHFAAGASGVSYETCATTNDALSFYGGDRQVHGSVSYKPFSDHLVIQYLGIGPWSSTSQMDVQIGLYTSGLVKMQYRNRTAAFSGGVQLRGPTGTTAVYGCPATLNTDRGVVFLMNGVTTTLATQNADLTFAVTTTAPLPANTWITNTATITDSRNVVYNRSAGTIINSVNLSGSTKIADRSQAMVGDPVGYTIVLHNGGLYTATDASLSDPIPANTTWNGIAPTCLSGTCGYASGGITWTGNITPGAMVTVTFGVTYTTPLPDLTVITNTATISDGLGGTFTRQAAFLARTPNLSAASKTVNPTVAQPGGVVTYTVFLYNSGGVDDNGQLVDPIPAGLTYEPGSLVFGSGSGGYAGGVITWTGSVPASSQIPVQFRATVDLAAVDGAIVNNTATITDVAWNTSYPRSAAFTVRRIADLYLNKAGPGTAGSGATLVYTLTYGNAGPNATPGNVNVVDTMPVSTTFVSSSAGGVYSPTARTVTWNVGTPTSGVSGTLSLVLSANSNLPALTVLTNTAMIDAIPQDANPADNTSQVVTVIGSNVNLSASSKTVDKTVAHPGEVLTYTLVVSNTGNAPAAVTVTDTLPAGLTYAIGSVSNAAYNDVANRIEWSGGLAAGVQRTITFRAAVNAGVPDGTSITNTVTLDDGVNAPVVKTATTRIGNQPDLSTSTKTVDQARVNSGGTVTYTITLVNTGNVAATVTITDPIPTGASYVLGSSTLNAASAGLYNDAANRVEWSGVVASGSTVSIRFRAVISTASGTGVTNTVTINDGAGTTFGRQAITQLVRYQVYLPLIRR